MEDIIVNYNCNVNLLHSPPMQTVSIIIEKQEISTVHLKGWEVGNF